MNKLLFPILFLVLLLSQSACHKYPDDIPSWLKERIKDLEKETRWHKGCLNDHCMAIKELKLDGKIIYFVDYGEENADGYIYTVFDYYGVVECIWQPAAPSQSCPAYVTAQYSRLIWSEKD